MARNSYSISIHLPDDSTPADVNSVVASLELPEGSEVYTSTSVNKTYHVPPGGGPPQEKPEPPVVGTMPADAEPEDES